MKIKNHEIAGLFSSAFGLSCCIQVLTENHTRGENIALIVAASVFAIFSYILLIGDDDL